MLINGDKIIANYELKIGSVMIPRVDHTKLLGVYVDEKLKWNVHTKYIADKISKMCGIVYVIRRKLTPQALRTIYLSLIYSHLIYCVPLWGNTWMCYLRPIEIAQKRALRTINSMGRYDHTHEVFVSQKLLKFKFIYMYFSLLLIFKYLNCDYVPHVFTRRDNRYEMRNAHNVLIPVTRLELYRKCIYFSAPSQWVNLPIQLKNIQNINTFKMNMKAHLLVMQSNL